MTPILPPTRARGLEINHRGQKEGVNVKLRGVDPPSQNGKQTGYIIKPSSAKAGENISVNGGGLIIRSIPLGTWTNNSRTSSTLVDSIFLHQEDAISRPKARNDKRQSITARSTADNQLQVQVGQGKSAVQLSIQVTPQGKRGEVELECVRNREGNGDTTGYTVSVKRPEEEPRADNQSQSAIDPRVFHRCHRYAYSPERSPSPAERRESSPDGFRDYHSEMPRARLPERSSCSPERSRDNFAASYQGKSYHSYRPEAHASQNASCCPVERPQSRGNESRNINTSPMRAPHKETSKVKESTEEYAADLLYKRKLDTHHHKPTISYIIARRMTELFKEMRKTAELHQPPFVKF